MSAIPDSTLKIQQEETAFRAAISDSVMTRVGGAVNWGINNSAEEPVGSVKMAMLTEAQIQAQVGETWVLADGRNVTGSDYATLFASTTIPDMRGTFTRMKDNGAGLDETGDPALASYEEDNVPYHTHTNSVSVADAIRANFTLGDDSGTGERKVVNPFTSPPTINMSVNPWGAGDGRPRNVTVNFFIKINVNAA